MRALIIVALAVAVSAEAEADAYTLAQVAAGQTAGGVITGVDYGHGLVSGVGALGTGRTIAAVHHPATVGVHAGHSGVHAYAGYPYAYAGYPHAYGKREAEAEPYTIGQVLAGQTNGGVITSVSYPGGAKVAGFPYVAVPHTAVYAHGAVPHTAAYAHGAFPHTAAVHATVDGVHPVHSYAAGLPLVYGKREAEPYTLDQVAHGAHLADAAAEGRAPGVITNAAVVPAAHLAAVVPAAHHLAAGYVHAGYPHTYAAGYPNTYAGYPWGGYWGRKKREAQYAHTLGVHTLGIHTLLPHTGAIPNPVHAVAHTPYGLTHSSNVGICTNYLGAVVPCRRKREAEAEPQWPGYALGVHTLLPHTGAIPNPVHAVAHTPYGLTHSSNVGICTNYLGAVVPCRRKREAEAEPQWPGYHHTLGLHTAIPNPVHAVAYTPYGLTHSSNVGICTNYLGAVVPC